MQFAIVIPIADLGAGFPGNALPGGPPVYPSHGLPPFPGYPSQGLPPTPGHPAQLPELPPIIWPPVPGMPSQPIALPPSLPSHQPIHPVEPSHPISVPPGTIWPPLPPDVPAGTAIVLVAISGVGWRWAVVNVPQPK